MNLSSLRPPKGSTHRKKRIGRGPGSGRGETAGRGENGQHSRSGFSRRAGFEGGQMPLVRRVPKRGFHNMFRKEFAVVNVERLNELEGSDFTPELLVERRVVRKLQDGLKILAEGEITRAINVSAHKISKAAQQKIEAAGGKVTLITEPVRRARKAAEEKPEAEAPRAAKKVAKKAAPKKAAKKAAKKVAKKATKKDA